MVFKILDKELVVINICNYLIFIAVFSDSRIMVATGLIGPLE